MLRKTYRLMQKTRSWVTDAQEGIMTAAAGFTRGGVPAEIPHHFSCLPEGFIKGDAGRGQELIRFAQKYSEQDLIALMGPQGSYKLARDFHRFSWVLDLWAVGTDEAARAAYKLMSCWSLANTDLKYPLHAPMDAAFRLLHVGEVYRFLFPVLNAKSHQDLIHFFTDHARYLHAVTGRRLQYDEQFFVGLSYAVSGVALGYGPDVIDHGLYVAIRALDHLIYADGGPMTRRPSDLFPFVRALLRLRDVMDAANIPMPEQLSHALDRSGSGLRFFDKGDGYLAAFHGGVTMDSHGVCSLIAHLNSGSGIQRSLTQTGFDRLDKAGVVLVIDTAQPGDQNKKFASCGAFEMSVQGQPVFVNCGPHAHDKMWQDLLAATAAHTALVLDDTDNIPLHGAGTSNVLSTQNDRGIYTEITHDGYLSRNKFMHTRQIFVASDGMDIRGADTVWSDHEDAVSVPYAVRFHVHPSISVTPVANGHAVCLRLPDQTSLYLHHDGAQVLIDDSVYLAATGAPEKTKQIVISGFADPRKTIIHWAIKAQG